MKFEFDSTKSRSNKEKHEIDFVEGQALWNSPTVEFSSKNQKEERRLVIGKIGTIFWTAIITHRDDTIRIISIRRSRDEEKKKFRNHHG